MPYIANRNLMNKLFKKEWFYGTVSMFICFLICLPLFGKYFFSPNSHMYAFGGDAFAIYYDISYHVCHGKSSWFEGMNYPHGELIFLTDAQGALTMILQWLNQYINICDYTIGIIHTLNVVAVLLASLVLYYALRALECSNAISVGLSPLIAVMSPQIMRLSGHFGLAYPLVLPLCMLWFLRKSSVRKIEKRDFTFFLIMVFFSFNNPYVGAGAAAFLLVASMIDGIWSKKYIANFWVFGVSLAFILIPFIYFKMSDPVSDRIKVQWGYFSFNTEFQGIIAPINSIIYRCIEWMHQPLKTINDETAINIGLVAVISLLVLIFHFLFRFKFLKNFSISKPFIIILLSTLVLFLYTSGLLFSMFEQEFIEENLGFLLMFKALARISWSIYFSLTLLSAILINHIVKGKSLSFVILILSWTIFIWTFELYGYMSPRFQNTVHDNFLSQKKKQEILEEIKSVDIQQFQAILCIPKMVMWSDNLISDHNFTSQFISQRISHATGLPLISAMLSRISTSQAMESIELLAHPLIEKSLQTKFPDKKDILLLVSKDNQGLSSGEQYLVAVSDTVFSSNSYTLMKLPLSKINDFEHQRDQLLTKYKNQVNTDAKAIIYMDFESEMSKDTSYYGKSSKRLTKGNHQILKHTFDNIIDSNYIVSVWTRIDHEKYGIGWFKCVVKNKNNEVVFEQGPDTRKSNDVHDQWIRTEVKFPVREGNSVEVSFEVNRIVYIDELLIRPENVIHVHESKNEHYLINGFKVKK